MLWLYWLIFALIFAGVPLGLVGIKRWVAKRNNLSKEQANRMNPKLGRYMLFYWLSDWFYISCVMQWKVATYVLGISVIAVLLASVWASFVSPTEKPTALKWGSLLDFAIGVAIACYLIHLIENQTWKDVLIPVVSALLGGAFTLAGVVLTIKWTHKENVESHLRQIEPFFYAARYVKRPENKSLVRIEFGEEGAHHQFYIAELTNSNKVEFVVESMVFAGVEMIPSGNKVVGKGESVFLNCKVDSYPLVAVGSVTLTVTDVEGNSHEYELTVRPYGHDYLISEIKSKGGSVHA